MIKTAKEFFDFLSISRATKRIQYITLGQIQMYCPRAILVPEWEFGMQTFEIRTDSLSTFFREHRIDKVLVKSEFYERNSPMQIELSTTTMIKCVCVKR